MNLKRAISKLRIYFNLKNTGEHFNKIRVIRAIVEWHNTKNSDRKHPGSKGLPRWPYILWEA
jgi:hypothetical protein